MARQVLIVGLMSILCRRTTLLAALLLASPVPASELDPNTLFIPQELDAPTISPDGTMVAFSRRHEREIPEQHPSARDHFTRMVARLVVFNAAEGSVHYADRPLPEDGTIDSDDHVEQRTWTPRNTLVILTRTEWLEYDPVARETLQRFRIPKTVQDKDIPLIGENAEEPILVSNYSFGRGTAASHWSWTPAEGTAKRLRSARFVQDEEFSTVFMFSGGRETVFPPNRPDKPYRAVFIGPDETLEEQFFQLPPRTWPAPQVHTRGFGKLMPLFAQGDGGTQILRLFDWRAARLLPGGISVERMDSAFIRSQLTRPVVDHLLEGDEVVPLADIAEPSVSRLLAELKKIRPLHSARVLSPSGDGVNRLVSLTAPHEPPEYFYWEEASQRLSRLASSMPWLPRGSLAAGRWLPGAEEGGFAGVLHTPPAAPHDPREAPVVFVFTPHPVLLPREVFSPQTAFLSEAGCHVVDLLVPAASLSTLAGLETPADIASWQTAQEPVLDPLLAAIDAELRKSGFSGPRSLVAHSQTVPIALTARLPGGTAWHRVLLLDPILPGGTPFSPDQAPETRVPAFILRDEDPKRWEAFLRHHATDPALGDLYVAVWKSNVFGLEREKAHARAVARGLAGSRKVVTQIPSDNHPVWTRAHHFELIRTRNLTDFILGLELTTKVR
jgi:hypothetical protein